MVSVRTMCSMFWVIMLVSVFSKVRLGLVS